MDEEVQNDKPLKLNETNSVIQALMHSCPDWQNPWCGTRRIKIYFCGTYKVRNVAVSALGRDKVYPVKFSPLSDRVPKGEAEGKLPKNRFLDFLNILNFFFIIFY